MGYRYKVVVDQFPVTDKVVDVLGVQSTHVETIALLSRETSRPAKDYVKVGIDAEEYYRIKEDK